MSAAAFIVPFRPRRAVSLAGFADCGGGCSCRRCASGLGALGLSQTGQTVAEAAASKGAAVGASAVAAYAGAGAVAGPVGAVVGAVVGLVVSHFFDKQYLNVAQVNADQDVSVKAFQQYMQVQGQAPGRAFGLHTMEVVWHGYFYTHPVPAQGKAPCYHNGCFKYPGNPEWIDITLGLKGTCGAHNCFEDAYQAFVSNQAPGHTATVPDAVTFVDHYLLPMNARAQYPWIPQEASDPTGHQVLYDVADAFLAAKPIATTPYVAKATPASAAVAPPASLAPTPSAPTVSNPVASPVAASATNPPAIGATVAAVPNGAGQLLALPAGFTFAGTDPASGAWVLDGAGGQYVVAGNALQPYTPGGAITAAPDTTAQSFTNAPPPPAAGVVDTTAASAPAGSTAGIAANPAGLMLSGSSGVLVLAAAGAAVFFLASRKKSR